eukprot:9488741-Pyramimonas_sp.AAC.1
MLDDGPSRRRVGRRPEVATELSTSGSLQPTILHAPRISTYPVLSSNSPSTLSRPACGNAQLVILRDPVSTGGACYRSGRRILQHLEGAPGGRGLAGLMPAMPVGAAWPRSRRQERAWPLNKK